MNPLALRLDHVSFRVSDLDKAEKFYADVLGCRVIDRPDLGFPGRWMRVGETVEIHLVTSADAIDEHASAPTPNGMANHVAFAVADLTAASNHLRRLGHEIGASEVGLAQIFVHDPDGNVIELIERSP